MTTVKPRLLITIYQNPDYYPPTVYAVRILRQYFDIYLLSRNVNAPFESWPADVTIERIGDPASARDKEAAAAGAKLIEYWTFIARTSSLVSALKPAAIYAYDAYALVAARFARPRRRSIPLIFHAHELLETDKLAATSLQTWVVRAALSGTKWADAVVFPERLRARHWLSAARDGREPIIAPNCPELSYFRAPADWSGVVERRLLAREAVYIGNASEVNGHLEALRALSLLDAAARLRVIGSYEPDFGTRFQALADELDVADRVSLDGRLGQAELLARASRATVGLSLHKPVSKGLEYLGSASNKLFEYAAIGLPAIVPDRASYREFLGDAEWVAYADIDDPKSIARAIERVLSDRERYVAMSRAARGAFERDYHYENAFAPVLKRVLELARVANPDQAPVLDPAVAQHAAIAMKLRSEPQK